MNSLRFVGVLLVTFLFPLRGITAKKTPSQLSVEQLKSLAESIRLAEDALLNVRIDSNSWIERGPCSSGPWQRTPLRFSTTAFFGKISSSGARIDVHKQVLPWENGAAPYVEQSYSVSFDGVEGRRKEISSSYSGKTFDRDRGVILPQAPWQLRSSDSMTGIQASLFFHFRDPPTGFPARFSSHFEAATDPDYYLSVLAAADPNYLDVKPVVRFKAVHQELSGIQCIKMAYIGDSLLKQWWLDPNRGFALLRFDDLRKAKAGNEQIKSSINVTKLEKEAENVWWPIEAYFVQCPHGTDKAWKRIVYRASKVVANDPKFDESIFTVPFPDGYLIDDQVSGRKYRVGQQ